MVEETLNRIKKFEDQARRMIEAAEKARALSLINSRKKTETLLTETEKSARMEAQAMIDQAKKEAESEKKEIEKRNQAEIEKLHKITTPKMEKARSLCR